MSKQPSRSPKERRGGPRVVAAVRVQVSGPDGWSHLLMSYDWSRNGVFLRTRAQFPVGTMLQLAVTFRKPIGRMTFTGKVARVLTLTKVGALQGLVVTFNDLPDDFARFLEETTSRPPPPRKQSAGK